MRQLSVATGHAGKAINNKGDAGDACVTPDGASCHASSCLARYCLSKKVFTCLQLDPSGKLCAIILFQAQRKKDSKQLESRTTSFSILSGGSAATYPTNKNSIFFKPKSNNNLQFILNQCMNIASRIKYSPSYFLYMRSVILKYSIQQCIPSIRK